MSPQNDRAARIAALKAQRAAQQSADDATPDDSTTTAPAHPGQTQIDPPRKQPTARAARLITIGASSTAALGLMTAIGIAEQHVGASIESAPASPPDQASVSQAPGTVRVSADASVVMVVVDDTGRPIDLRQMSSVSELQQFLATAQPIVDLSSFTESAPQAMSDSSTITTPPAAETATQPGAIAPTVASGEPRPTPATDAPVEATQPASPTPTDTTPAPAASPVVETTQTIPAPPEPATTAPPATVPAATSPPATTTPTTTVPVAQPAPIVITLPSPTPPPAQGNTGGS